LALSAELAEDDALLQTSLYQGLSRLSQDGQAVEAALLLSFLRVWVCLELPLRSGQAPELFRPMPLPDPLYAERAYAIWAPDESPWSAWTKPAPFVSMKTTPLHKLPSEFDVSASGIGQEPGTPGSSLTFDDVLRRERALLVDLPGELAVRMGLRLARTGHRPVPLFNACVGPSGAPALVNAEQVQQSLLAATPTLARCRIDDDAPPVFLLDSGRDGARRRPQPRDYDNRWVLLPQDLPSAQRLMQAGIKELWLLSEKLKDDVQHVLYRYQRDGLVLRHCGVESWLGHGVQLSSPRPLELKRPSGFGWIWYRMKVLAGLKRNAAGGFGAVIPVPSSSSG
jgi:hypothetical protein